MIFKGSWKVSVCFFHSTVLKIFAFSRRFANPQGLMNYSVFLDECC